ASALQQQHHHQAAWPPFEQQQSPFEQHQSPFQQLLGHRAAAPSALTLTPVFSWRTADPQSSISTRSSQSWQGSSSGNPSESLSSPTSSMLSLVAPQFVQSAGETRPVQPVDSPETPKRRRGRPRLSETSQRARTAQTPARTAKKTKRQRASTTSASEDDDSSSKVGDGGGGGGGSDDDDKRNRVRARNREAAHKCRQKTQKGISQLQTQEAVMGGINKSLKSEVEMLREEILLLKHMALQHSGCGCSFIEEYIAGAAQNLVQSGARISATPRGGNAETDGQHSMAGGDECYIDRRAYDTHSKAEMYLTGFESGFFDFESTPYHAAGIQL
ncbi:bZIP transcription factor, partial [Colletotrichum graminicola M1.001]